MGRPFVFDIPDLAGGLNESAPENIADREMARFQNFFVRGQSAFSRLGMEALVSGTYSEKITDIARYKPGFTSDEYLLLGCAASIARVNGDAIEALSIADAVYPTLTTRWWHEQYNDEMFWCRKGNGGIKRVYGDVVCEGGIPAPTTAPNVADGGPGKKEAGKYQIAYRYYNTQTGARGNWSPWSREIEIADLHKLNVSEIGVSTHPQVNARQIGATRITNGVMYLVGQINDNVTTTFVENAADAGYGEADVDVNGNPQSDYRHGMPPSQAWALALHKVRLFVLNKDGLYFSEPGWMQSFKASSFMPIQKGTGLLSWLDHGLVITTETDAQILAGDTPSDWRTDKGNLSKEHGCAAGKSLAVGDGILFYYTGVNIVRTDGGPPVILPRIERVRDTLDDIPEASKEDVFGETVPSRGWYVLNVPQSDGSRKAIVYDYKNDTFETFTSLKDVYAMARLGQPNQAEAVLIATYSGGVSSAYEFLSSGRDGTSAITAILRTKNFGWDRGVQDKVTRVVGLLTNQVVGTVTLRVYHDDTLVYTRSNVSLNKAGWKRYVVNTSGTPGALVAVEVEYTGTSQLEVKQMQIGGVNLGRQVVPV